jgi:hypothetical protein
MEKNFLYTTVANDIERAITEGIHQVFLMPNLCIFHLVKNGI